MNESEYRIEQLKVMERMAVALEGMLRLYEDMSTSRNGGKVPVAQPGKVIPLAQPTAGVKK